MRPESVLRAAVAPVVESLESRTLLSINLVNGVLTVVGTPGNDTITFSLKAIDSNFLRAKSNAADNSERAVYAVSDITQIQAYGLTGNDLISASGLSIPVAFYGGGNSDTLVGGAGNDTLVGGARNDLLIGNGGNNTLRGAAGDDRILGGSGNDTIDGGVGHDVINGGGGTDIISSANPADVNAGAGILYQPLYRAASPGAVPSAVFQFGAVGLVPNQIRTAYGFGSLSDPNFTTRGRGQTIYIVDAFTGSNVLGDLNVFSAEFGLPLMDSNSFQIVNANDGGLSPAVDPLWAGEIAMDVQWAHAIAPKARIVLVQADTALPQDLFRAVQLAARMSEGSNGGVVSMSFSLPPEADPFNSHFENVFKSSPRTTFVAAAGDTTGASYPATSPNVLAVGGTLLLVDPSGIPITDETAWQLTGGGTSAVYSHPSYQDSLRPNNALFNRLVPDVAYNADPESGIAVYNSTNTVGIAGWMPGGFGGTSAGAVQWAALIALTNNVRARTGQPTIGSHAIVDIYQIAQQNPSAFNDITSGGPVGQIAGPGFDLSTGWGTPHATELISLLASTNAPFLATATSWSGTMYRSSLAPNTSATTSTNFTVPMGGTGYASGGSRINLSFTAVPNHWDTTGVIAVISATGLYRSPANAQGVSRVYGDGSVSFHAYTAFDGLNHLVVVPTGGSMKFNGVVTVDAQGNEHISVDFWAVDGFGQPWPTSPFQLAQLDTPQGGHHVSFKGSLKG